VLSGGERTRLAVARMLLRPSNTLLLDEPTNHLDLDSKDVLLEALADYGGTLIIVSHDRYFVEKLATKIIEIGHGQALVYPGTYKEFLWHKEGSGLSALGSRPGTQKSRAQDKAGAGSQQSRTQEPKAQSLKPKAQSPKPTAQSPEPASREARKQQETERRKRDRENQALQKRIIDLEGRIAEREAQVKELEAIMATAGFYDDRKGSKQVVDRHQALMWEVGELMAQWEALQEHAQEAQGS
jgi:ATP-binding cassette, subfamily F, member 3